MNPVIGITASLDEGTKKAYKTNFGYVDSIILSGGIPMMIPVAGDVSNCRHIIHLMDALLIPGGEDVSPSLYNEEPIPQVTHTRKSVDIFEIEMIRLAREYNKPILGICRGMQVINVAFGGSLYQDIAVQYRNEICHSQSTEVADEPTHKVYLKENSHIAEILKANVVEVNSHHHQAVKNIAENLIVSGQSKDGVIEAIESQDGRIIGVQWHPELMVRKSRHSENLFRAFIAKCGQNN